MKKRKLKINMWAGILAIINSVLFAVSIFAVTFAAFDEAFGGTSDTNATATFFYVMAAVSLVIHIVGLIKSKKVGISITGHILGIIGSGLFVLAMLFALPSMVLMILAAVFCLKQKNVNTEDIVG